MIDSEAVLTSTHNLCFVAKIRKIGIPLNTPVLLYKSGVQRGVHYTHMFSWWILFALSPKLSGVRYVDTPHTCLGNNIFVLEIHKSMSY